MGGCGLVEVVSVQTLVVCWVACGFRFWWIWWCGYVLWLPTVVVLVGLIWALVGGWFGVTGGCGLWFMSVVCVARFLVDCLFVLDCVLWVISG